MRSQVSNHTHLCRHKYLFCSGKVHPDNGTLTGDAIAYIYPDMETAFIGRFENKFMRAARETEVKVLFHF